MGTLIAIGLMVALFLWIVRPGTREAVPPEDDVSTPVDEDELAEAERELAEDPEAQTVDEAFEDDDDWGPGTGGRGPLPGII